ncbi:MAG: hypothetical protein D6803_00385 [Anaerolineae bacterium]|nr:MAG: hypothetical protein D6803_00385 [Anaerolineae bacterium]
MNGPDIVGVAEGSGVLVGGSGVGVSVGVAVGGTGVAVGVSVGVGVSEASNAPTLKEGGSAPVNQKINTPKPITRNRAARTSTNTGVRCERCCFLR